jgi:hypothetical protein
MKAKNRIPELLSYLLVTCVIALGLASIVATGGGGGGSSSSGSGSVAVYLSDGPADDYDHIWIWVTEVSLIPPEGSNNDAVIIFQSDSPEGYMVDLLAYRDEDFLLTLKRKVPPGRYEKIRLKVDKIESEGGECDLEMIKLPSGKIDLNPQGGFEVHSGETLSIRLDIDANKSINLHAAGKSGKCIFRPVVFVDIEAVDAHHKCPKTIKGEIEGFTDAGFILNLGDGRGTLEVNLEDAVIFDEEGLPSTSDNLEIGQTVRVRGRLDADGIFLASLVISGDVLVVNGTVEGSVDGNGIFPLGLDPEQQLVGESVDVKITEETFILIGCDTQVNYDAIQEGMRARVIGKYATDDQEMRAIAVLLRPEEIIGEILSSEETTGGYLLTIQISEGQNITVFVPSDAQIYLEGDGEISADLLCEGRQVRISLDPDRPASPTATQVWVQADILEGSVAGNEPGRILFIDEQRVFVPLGATILDTRGDDDVLMTFDEIINDDNTIYELKCFGLTACPDDAVFTALVVLVVGP